MKKLAILILVITIFISCKKEDTTTVNDVVNEAKANTEVVAKEGTGKITLTCNGKELITEGVCGALVSMDELTIAVKDKTNPAKVFTMTFNGEDFPKSGIIYKINAKNYLAEGKSPKDEVAVSFAEGLPNNKMNAWGSENTKGNLQFTESGNEIKCVFKDVVLTASEMFNADDLKGKGIVSGELIFYKD
ncbi:hypothetical protein [Flavobacterium sp.]|uniref:hypothetical protein n=1 Tax=Flavobacterium sp. TaxID=239 RepID=UPI0038FCF06E